MSRFRVAVSECAVSECSVRAGPPPQQQQQQQYQQAPSAQAAQPAYGGYSTERAHVYTPAGLHVPLPAAPARTAYQAQQAQQAQDAADDFEIVIDSTPGAYLHAAQTAPVAAAAPLDADVDDVRPDL